MPVPAHRFTSVGAALNRHDIMTVEEGKIAMVMPKLSCNLDDAIEGKLFKTPKAKVTFAHRLLSALAFLQDNGIVHRLGISLSFKLPPQFHDSLLCLKGT